MQSYFFKTQDGYKIHYQVTENILPETTFFIHGNLASNRWWLPSEEIWKQNAKNKNLKGHMVCLEFLGCGQSDAPREMQDVDMIDFATTFNELIDVFLMKNNLKNQKVNLVGHSTGGFIAATMTALRPDLFNKALLLDPVGAKGLELTEQIKAGFEAMKADKNIAALAIGATIYKNNPENEFFQKVIVEDTFLALQKISYWVVHAFHQLDATDLLRHSTTPTVVLHGEHDNLLSREASEELAQKYLQKAKFEIIPGHGHCMNVENPEAFVQKVNDFLF